MIKNLEIKYSNLLLRNDPIELDGNPIEIVNINDDTCNFPRETGSLLELKDEPSPKIEQKSVELPEIEKVRLSTPEELADTEKMIQEDRKNELRKLRNLLFD
jgi:hypothetical protein